MKNHSVAFLTASFFLLAINSPLILAQTSSTDQTVCQAFETLRTDYTQSLGKDETGKPMASEQSVQVAWELAGAAQDCFTERKVAFERISTYAFKILPMSDSEPGKTAALLYELTGGVVIYDVGFFLRKPYAAGGFEENILFLPHTAVLGKIDMVTRHELNHAQAHSLLLNDDLRLRHLWIFGEDSMYVDEVLAYADNGINNANAERMKSWSLDMAHQYIAGTRKLLKDPQSEVATQMEGQRCPMSPALRDELSDMLGCIENVLQSEDAQPAEVSACDGPRLQADLCAQ